METIDKAEEFARRIVSRITEGNIKETFEADVLDVAADLREFARSRVIELLDRIEQHTDEIYVREIIYGKHGNFRNISLLELPTHLAIRHICRMLRVNLENGEPL